METILPSYICGEPFPNSTCQFQNQYCIPFTHWNAFLSCAGGTEYGVQRNRPSYDVRTVIPNTAITIGRFVDSFLVEIVEIQSAEFFGHVLKSFQVFLASMIRSKVLLTVTASAKKHKWHRNQPLSILFPKSLPVISQSNPKIGR